ncbi:MAG TPA: hypothetical protein DCE41_01980 [Cytophagales bacterium]|nr:hypothetical protein [Cytophagales bacterium]HAA18897.1 hypothetical protein [Cytophagales bacterium]HAP61982.1 hypothetical protein [Cytophagales bacterium]
MAINKKGFRKITVRGHSYWWKFKETVLILDEEDKNCQLIVDFGWYDTWLYIKDPENAPPPFSPQVVTPKFVDEALQFALDQGWKEGKWELVYRNMQFGLKE